MSSKFKGIFDAAKGRPAEPPADDTPPSPPAPNGTNGVRLGVAGRAESPAPRPPVHSGPEAPSPLPYREPTPLPRKPGRPPGKRSDPGFAQVTAYVPADLHRQVKIALLQEGGGQEFSELVTELLAGWLRSKR